MPMSDFKVGVIQLNTNFPRPLGDIGNSETFGSQSIVVKLDLATVADAISTEVIHGPLLDEMVEVALELEAKGCDLITTSCCFWAPSNPMFRRMSLFHSSAPHYFHYHFSKRCIPRRMRSVF